jgi:hypothetical protein
MHAKQAYFGFTSVYENLALSLLPMLPSLWHGVLAMGQARKALMLGCCNACSMLSSRALSTASDDHPLRRLQSAISPESVHHMTEGLACNPTSA